MNALGYIRISKHDQSNYSLEGQERLISDYCHRHGLKLIASFKDDGEKSYTFDRPDFKALEDFIKKNRNGVQYLIIYEHDRFSRNLAEALLKIKELQDKHNIKVLATTDHFDTDFSDPTTFLTRAFKYMIAESELHRIRKRTKDGLLQAALSGRFVNKAPYGYINARDTEGKSIILIDEEKAAHVRLIFSEYIRGSNVEEVRRIAKQHGFTSKGNSVIQKILSNPLYAGLIVARPNDQTQLVKGLHAAIVSEADYWLVQQKLKRRGIITHNSEDFPLRGVLRSAFGGLLTGAYSRGRSGRLFGYYVDKKNKLNFPIKKLHEQLGDMLENMSLSQQEIEEKVQQAELIISKAAEIKGYEGKRLATELNRIKNRIESVEEKYLSTPDLSKEVYTKTITNLRADEARLQTEYSKLSRDELTYMAKFRKMLPKLANLKTAYEELPLNKKQEFLNLCFNHSLYYANGSYRTTFLHYAFKHKEQILKEKRLLIVEQPSIKLGTTPHRSGIGS